MYRRDPRGGARAPGAGAAPAGPEGRRPTVWLITLVSSLAPLPLAVSGLPDLPGAMVFRSRRVEEGRERYRLHVGYFATEELALATLARVRPAYPQAFVEPAPDRGLGSLEDTGVAKFSVLQWGEAEAAAVPAPASPRADPAPEPPPPRPASPPPASPSRRAAAAAPATPAGRASLPPAPPLPDPATARVPEPAAEAAAQQYAVQLAWAAESIDCTRLPRLPIFGSYLTYAVETEAGGRRWYGVRLGFFRDLLSAQLVAQYIHPEYRRAIVVPVSDREVDRASRAAIRLATARAEPGRVRWPGDAIPVQASPLRRGG